MTDAKLLRAAQAVTGLSVNKFAESLGRNPRTVKAWRAQGTALVLPPSVKAQLTRITARPSAARAFFRPLGATQYSPSDVEN